MSARVSPSPSLSCKYANELWNHSKTDRSTPRGETCSLTLDSTAATCTGVDGVWFMLTSVQQWCPPPTDRMERDCSERRRRRRWRRSTNRIIAIVLYYFTYTHTDWVQSAVWGRLCTSSQRSSCSVPPTSLLWMEQISKIFRAGGGWVSQNWELLRTQVWKRDRNETRTRTWLIQELV